MSNPKKDKVVFRVVFKTIPGEDGKPPTQDYGIYEVYLNQKKEIIAISDDPIAPFGTCPKEIFEDIQAMQRSFLKPIINFNTVKYGQID